jgi:hypothetical protein
MIKHFLRHSAAGITCAISFARRSLVGQPEWPSARIVLRTKKGDHLQNHRVYKNGNSYVMTLSTWQLNHIGVLPGQYVQVESKRSKRLVVTKAPRRIQPPIPPP